MAILEDYVETKKKFNFSREKLNFEKYIGLL